MESTAPAAHDGHHHELPTEGRALTAVSVSATLHCLTGCAIGEVAGMAIGTAAGMSNGTTIALSIALAFFFGYALTSLPLLRAGLALAAVIPIALASDTFSILAMEIVDNLIMVVIPGALHAGLGDLLFWGSLSFALSIAFLFAVPVNRFLIRRGKGHVAVHETGVHGGRRPLGRRDHDRRVRLRLGRPDRRLALRDTARLAGLRPARLRVRPLFVLISSTGVNRKECAGSASPRLLSLPSALSCRPACGRPACRRSGRCRRR